MTSSKRAMTAGTDAEIRKAIERLKARFYFPNGQPTGGGGVVNQQNQDDIRLIIKALEEASSTGAEAAVAEVRKKIIEHELKIAERQKEHDLLSPVPHSDCWYKGALEQMEWFFAIIDGEGSDTKAGEP